MPSPATLIMGCSRMKSKHRVLSGCLLTAMIGAFSLNALAGIKTPVKNPELDSIIEQAKTLGDDQIGECDTERQVSSKPLRLSISLQIPVNAEGASKARKTLYALAASECALITQHIHGQCEITNFKIRQQSNKRQIVANQDSQQILIANINFEIVPPVDKSDCK